ncbi:MAG: HD domain-containing protein [Candidatus Hadarchaeota archaeon]
MADEKTIHDPVHGSMTLGGIILDLIDTAEVQRLRGIRQLGLANVAFPGANHSRFEHALGVGHLALKVANKLGLKEDEKNLLVAAATLHDVGHAPYSHTLEHLMVDYLKKDHMEITGQIIQGKMSIAPENEAGLRKLGLSRANQVLKKWGVSSSEVSQLLVGKHRRRYLGDLIHSEVDVDQMDYLLRDSHFTGVALGMVDIDRLMRTLVVHGGRTCIMSKGVEAVEGLLTARGLMYSSVYYHHTVRAAEVMMTNAVDMALEKGRFSKNFFLMDDAQLMEQLSSAGGYPAEMAARLRYRQLFKSAYVETRKELSDSEKKRYLTRFGKWSDVRAAQDGIADEAGAERGRVLLDVPIVDIITSEPRIAKVDMPVVHDGKVSKLSKVSPLATALKQRQAPRYMLRVISEEKLARKVKRAAERVLG